MGTFALIFSLSEVHAVIGKRTTVVVTMVSVPIALQKRIDSTDLNTGFVQERTSVESCIILLRLRQVKSKSILTNTQEMFYAPISSNSQ